MAASRNFIAKRWKNRSAACVRENQSWPGVNFLYSNNFVKNLSNSLILFGSINTHTKSLNSMCDENKGLLPIPTTPTIYRELDDASKQTLVCSLKTVWFFTNVTTKSYHSVNWSFSLSYIFCFVGFNDECEGRSFAW